MKLKKRMSMTVRVSILLILLFVLVVCLLAGFIAISNVLSRISSGDITDVESSLETIEGLILVLIFLTISFLVYLAKTIYDIYTTGKENYYAIEINKLTSKIDQQTTIENLDFWNDRLAKLVGNFAGTVRNDMTKVYRGLFQIYMIKSMKTESDFEKIKMYTSILIRAYAEVYSLKEVYIEKKIEHIANAAVMYDIGKLGTPGYILYKEGNLDSKLFEMAKRHANVGFDIATAIKPNMRLGTFEQYLRDIAGYHHERFDGTGYPWGKKGEEIPFISRVIAIVTTYDTITRDRPYKKAMTHDEAVLLINNEKGLYFDPKIVKVFNGIEREFRKILERIEV